MTYMYTRATRDYAKAAYHFLALFGAIAGAEKSFHGYFDSFWQMDISARLKQEP